MDKVSDLPNTVSIKIMTVLSAYKNYQTAVGKDELSRVDASAKLPDAQAFYNDRTGGVIIILPERHDSTDNQVKAGAAAVAKHVMTIPKVKIAVEEPINYNGTLISNVGWAENVGKKPQSMALFDFEPAAEGSISHQIYVRQVGGMVISTSRYAAEKMPRETRRYNNPEINRTMAKKLTDNTAKAGDVSVFPVGPDHLLMRYDHNTLSVHLGTAGWKTLVQG